jgi:integrase
MKPELSRGVNRTVAENEDVTKARKPRKSDPYDGERQWFTAAEIDKLMTTARKHGRHGNRNALMVLLGFVHGFRASELCRLKWSDIDWSRGLIHCRRVKNGINTDHPLTGRELRGLRKLKNDQRPVSRYVFTTERGGAPMTPDGFYKLMVRLGEKAKIESARPHRLRHSCGFKLANDGRDTRAIQFYLGHSDIRSTCRYTDVVASRFEGFFED